MFKKYKVKNRLIFATLLIVTLFHSFNAFSDNTLPCSGDDTYNNTCPLDTWVWVLVVGAAIVGTIILTKRQRLQNNHD